MEKGIFKKRLFIGIILYAIGFILLFGFRLLYGYLAPEATRRDNTTNYIQQSQNSDDAHLLRKNYASTKLKQTSVMVDQKYEKVASISSKTDEFEKSETSLRDSIKKFNALIQYEESTGLKGYRNLNLAIGVYPDKFDEMTEVVKQIGEITSLQINKSDKTNEYKDLSAKKLSLEKSYTALIELKKTTGGKIDELINLENKILEIEQNIQNLGVKLGEFDAENEFCTIKYTLSETGIKKANISFFRRLLVAFEWTCKYYLLLTAIAFFAFFGSWFALLMMEKLGIFQAILDKL